MTARYAPAVRGLIGVWIAVSACGPQKPPPTGYYPGSAQAQPAPLSQEEYPDPGAAKSDGVYLAPEDPALPPYPEPYVAPGGQAMPVMPPPGPVMPDPRPAPVAKPPPPSGETTFWFNGHAATPTDLAILAQLDRMYRTAAPPGAYWYDAASGAAGRWGGPALGHLPAGLALGGRLPANASGGGTGRLTGVFVNGRELHPVDVQVLTGVLGQAIAGRWWVDAQGNAGPDGGRAVMNWTQLARRRGTPASTYFRRDGRGDNAFVGGGCVVIRATSGDGSAPNTPVYSSSGC